MLIHDENRPTIRRSLPQIRTLFCLGCVILLSACTADASRMVSVANSGLPVRSPWEHSLCPRRSGGEQWNLLSQAGVVEDAAFQEALEKTLAQNQLLSAPSACKYYLDVEILGITQPGQGLFVTSVQTDAHINYKIFDGNQRPAFLDTVSSSYTEPFSLLPAARMQRASEGAVRTNFEVFLQHLAQRSPSA